MVKITLRLTVDGTFQNLCLLMGISSSATCPPPAWHAALPFNLHEPLLTDAL